MPYWSWPVVVGLSLLVLVLGFRTLLTAARARRLERQRRLLLDDVDVLQRALVPEVAERLGDLSISAAYLPSEGPAAGGDFYDVFQLGDGRVAVILGDVAGHGPGAIAHAALVRYTIRAYVEAGLEPRAALKLAGSVLGEDDQERFATVAVGVFEEPVGLLTYSLAGHPPPLLLGAGIREPLSICSCPPVGLGLETGLRQTTVSFSRDAVACFFTDGLVEARVDDAMLGRENLERLLVTLGPEAVAADLLMQPVDHAPDDRAVCLMRLSCGPVRPPLQVEELALERLDIGSAEPARFLEGCAVAPKDIETALAAAQAAAGRSGVIIRVQLAECGGSIVEVQGLDARAFGPTPALVRRPGAVPASDSLSGTPRTTRPR